jgi:ankyrin repeat protein
MDDVEVYRQVKLGNLDLLRSYVGAHRVLYHAAEKGDLNVVKHIVEMRHGLINRPNERMNGSTALMAACLNTREHVDTVKYLVDHGSDLTLRSTQRAWGNTAFHWAAVRGAEEALKVLLSKYPEGRNLLDSGGRTPLQMLQMDDATKWFDKKISGDLDNIDSGNANDRRGRMIRLLQE